MLLKRQTTWHTAPLQSSASFKDSKSSNSTQQYPEHIEGQLSKLHHFNLLMIRPHLKSNWDESGEALVINGHHKSIDVPKKKQTYSIILSIMIWIGVQFEINPKLHSSSYHHRLAHFLYCSEHRQHQYQLQGTTARALHTESPCQHKIASLVFRVQLGDDRLSSYMQWLVDYCYSTLKLVCVWAWEWAQVVMSTMPSNCMGSPKLELEKQWLTTRPSPSILRKLREKKEGRRKGLFFPPFSLLFAIR